MRVQVRGQTYIRVPFNYIEVIRSCIAEEWREELWDQAMARERWMLGLIRGHIPRIVDREEAEMLNAMQVRMLCGNVDRISIGWVD